jgi:hypothetical protein
MERTKLQELGRKLNDALLWNNSDWVPKRLQAIRDEVYEVARREAGVSTSDLADEGQEDSARVRLYWTLVSLLMSQVLSEAANQQVSYKGWNR